MSNQNIIPLSTDLQRQEAAIQVLHAASDHVCILKPDTPYMRRQREMWGMLSAISKQVKAPQGGKYSPSEWRSVLIAMWTPSLPLQLPDTDYDNRVLCEIDNVEPRTLAYWPPQDEWAAEAYEAWLAFVAEFARANNVHG